MSRMLATARKLVIMKNMLTKTFPFGWRDNLEYVALGVFIVLIVDSYRLKLYLLALGVLIYGKEVWAYHSGKTVWKLRPVKKSS